MIRFVLQRLSTGEFWGGSNRWAAHPSGALWFESYGDAEWRGLRQLPDCRADWAVRELKADANGVQLQTRQREIA